MKFKEKYRCCSIVKNQVAKKRNWLPSLKKSLPKCRPNSSLGSRTLLKKNSLRLCKLMLLLILCATSPTMTILDVGKCMSSPWQTYIISHRAPQLATQTCPPTAAILVQIQCCLRTSSMHSDLEEHHLQAHSISKRLWADLLKCACLQHSSLRINNKPLNSKRTTQCNTLQTKGTTASTNMLVIKDQVRITTPCELYASTPHYTCNSNRLIDL